MNAHIIKFIALLSLSLTLLCCDSSDKETASHSITTFKNANVTPRAVGDMEQSSFSIESNKIPQQKRMIIKTATITCEINSYDETFSAIEKIVTKRNGFIVNSLINSTKENKKSGSITLRIPSTVFEETLEEVSRLSSRVLSKSINGNDITEEFYDVAMRIENKRKIESRYREILKSAKTVKDILQVEEALGNVREEIDGLEGRKRFLADQTALSTINVNLQEPQALVMVEGGGFWTKIANGFRHGLTGFADVLSFCITILISTIPVSVFLLLIILFLVPLIRYMRSRKRIGEEKKSKR
jgi:hypothetical protein